MVLAHSHANTFGGGERAVLEVARQLAPRYAVRLLLGGFDPRRTYPELASFPHRRLGRLEWPLARINAEAIVTNSFGANLLAFRNGPRVAYWVHSTRSRFLHAGTVRLDLLLRRAVDWLAVRKAGRLVANSRYTAVRLRRLYGREADAIVYPGVDLGLFQPGHGEGRYAITVGRLAPEKGLDRLLEIWRDLPDLPLHIIGDGKPDVMRELRRRSPAGVIFRGRLTPNELAEAYRAAAVAVFAPHAEEFGIAPLEAMASGLPVVAWREGGLVETIVDGETGYLVDDGVTLRQRVRLLVHDANLRWLLGDAGRARAEDYSWQRTAASLEAVIHQLLRG